MNRDTKERTREDDQIDFEDTLKKIFDHFRNYIICASLFYIGVAAIRHPEWHHIGGYGTQISFLVVLITGILTLANTVQVVGFIVNNVKPMRVPGKNRKRGFLMGPFLVLTYLSIAYVIVVVALNIKLSGH